MNNTNTTSANAAYSVEEFWADVLQSEVYTGVKYTSAAISLPPTGMARINFSGTGKDLAQTGTTQYFTSPAALGSAAVTAAVNGALIIDGVPHPPPLDDQGRPYPLLHMRKV